MPIISTLSVSPLLGNPFPILRRQVEVKTIAIRRESRWQHCSNTKLKQICQMQCLLNEQIMALVNTKTDRAGKCRFPTDTRPRFLRLEEYGRSSKRSKYKNNTNINYNYYESNSWYSTKHFVLATIISRTSLSSFNCFNIEILRFNLLN